MIDDTIFTPKSSAAARKRYIYYPDHLVQMPGPGQSAWERITSILTEPVFAGFVKGAFMEAFQRPTNLGDESIGSFISRRVHKAVAENMVSALLHGIYAGDVWQLSTKSLFPLQWHFEKHYGSMVEGLYRTMTQNVTVMPARDSELLLELANQKLEKDFEMKLSRCSVFAFRNGLQQLAKRLEARLAENGNVSFKPNTAVKSLEHDRPAGKIKVRLPPILSVLRPLNRNRSQHAMAKASHPKTMSSQLSTPKPSHPCATTHRTSRYCPPSPSPPQSPSWS